MPKKLEKALKKIARKRGYDKEKANAYIYGTLNRIKTGKPVKRSKGV